MNFFQNRHNKQYCAHSTSNYKHFWFVSLPWKLTDGLITDVENNTSYDLVVIDYTPALSVELTSVWDILNWPSFHRTNPLDLGNNIHIALPSGQTKDLKGSILSSFNFIFSLNVFSSRYPSTVFAVSRALYEQD